jgi:predicted small secreted protein
MRTITSTVTSMMTTGDRSLILALALTACALGFLSLSACNTTAGMGRDVQKVGRVIEREAVEHRP